MAGNGGSGRQAGRWGWVGQVVVVAGGFVAGVQAGCVGGGNAAQEGEGAVRG